MSKFQQILIQSIPIYDYDTKRLSYGKMLPKDFIGTFTKLLDVGNQITVNEEFVKAINKYSLNPTTKEIWKNFSTMLEDYHFAKEANKTFDVNKNTKWFLRNYLNEHTQNIEASTVNEFCEKAMKESERIIRAEEKIEEYSKAELGKYYMKQKTISKSY